MKRLLLLICVFLGVGSATAEDLKISLAEIPHLSYYDKNHKLVGAFPVLLKLLDEHYAAGNFKLTAFPFGRSINNVIVGKADAHVPLINTGSDTEQPYQYVDEPLLTVTFVIYSHMDKPVSKTADLSQLSIDTVIGHQQFFNFPIGEVVDFQTGLKKVVNKRIDAFIMEQDAGDSLIRLNGYNTLHRAHFRTWDSSIVVARNGRGAELNAKLSAAIRNLKADPRYKDAAHAVHAPFKEWQPHQ
ncbi:substrate-binding periplasmic protein [Roseibium sp.]|uniref:substrate-binding periplasmic protein n=1 Tax=Roseibium sp. TaxID=1936156 RepID=UPI003B52D9A5